MAENVLVDPPIGILNKSAEPPKQRTAALAYLIVGSGLALTVAWSGFLVWMTREGVLWLLSELS